MTDPRVVRCAECCRWIPETEASFLGPDPYEWRCAFDKEACDKLAKYQREFRAAMQASDAGAWEEA